MPRSDNVKIHRESPTPTSFRAAKIQGMFDIPAQPTQTFDLDVSLPLGEEEWKVGVVVGASGSGKSTLARELWPEAYREPGVLAWAGDCIVDDFPDETAIGDITSALASVGFSSAPAWLRPYAVLSTGQKHRAEIARLLTLGDPLLVCDEFTSVVDRTVAKALSTAVAKHVRRHDGQFVAVTCHRDILAWLEPDWVYDTDLESFAWTRGSLQRPEVPLCVRAGSRGAWPLFRGHHYLSADLAVSARVLLAFVTLDGEERLAGFVSLLPRMGMKGWWRGHRHVVLPDFQGLGIGNRMVEIVAEQMWRKEGKRYAERTSAPSFIAHRRARPEMWRLSAAPGMTGASGNRKMKVRTSAGRLGTTWEYLPEQMRAEPGLATSI